MVRSLGDVIIKYPTSFGFWLSGLFEMTGGTNEIAIIGNEFETYLQKTLQKFIPHKVVMATKTPLNEYPLLADKGGQGETLIYLCKNYVCQRPVNTVEGLRSLLSMK
jgi:hypothetical protein